MYTSRDTNQLHSNRLRMLFCIYFVQHRMYIVLQDALFSKYFIIDKPPLCMCTEFNAYECEIPSQNRVHACYFHDLWRFPCLRTWIRATDSELEGSCSGLPTWLVFPDQTMYHVNSVLWSTFVYKSGSLHNGHLVHVLCNISCFEMTFLVQSGNI